jgi:flagella basal body P-ring formation protein FlgA
MLRQQLENCVVGRAPLPGRSRQIEGNYIKLKMKQSGIDVSRIALKTPEFIEITRRSMTISASELKTIARTFIKTNAPYALERVKIKKIQANQDVVLPSGKITYQVKPPQHTDYVGNVPLAITFKCNGASVKKVWVMVTVAVMSDIVVAKKPVGRYQVIKMADIDLQTMDLAKMPNNALTSLEDVVGQRAKRTIDTQTVLTSSMIETPPLVRRGDIVVMIAESGGLRISTQGEARQKGAKGDRIKVMNLDSRKSVYGRIIDRSTVKVDF